VLKDTILGAGQLIQRFFYVVVILLVVALGLSFALLNSEPVTFNYYIGKHDIELSLILVITLIIGALLGVAGSFGVVLKTKRQTFKIKKEMKNSAKELNNLRSLSKRESL